MHMWRALAADVRDDASRTRTASEELPVVARLVLVAGCRPGRRRPGRPACATVRLEPREGGREGRDDCGDCRSAPQDEHQAPVSLRTLARPTDGRSRHLAEATGLEDSVLPPDSGGSPACACRPGRPTNPPGDAARGKNSPFASCGHAAGGRYPRRRGRGRGVLPAAAGSRPGMPPLPRARVPAAGRFLSGTDAVLSAAPWDAPPVCRD